MYQQHSSYTSPQTPTYPYGSNPTANKPSHDAVTSSHHPLARPASMPPSYHQKYAASSAANDCYGFSADPKQSFGPPPPPLERGSTHYDSPIPRAWQQQQQQDPYSDANGDANTSSNTEDLYANGGNEHLPTSLPAPMPYSHSNYFAPPPPSTPVPPSASAGGTILYGAGSDRQHHLYHPYGGGGGTGSSRRHSASNSGGYGYGGPLPSFALHHGASRHPLLPRPKLTTTLWEDEGTICYQVDANGICVARRHDNDMINGTKLLNVAGMSRGKRDGILKNEKGRVVVKVGAMHLKGVWITYARAKALATQFKILDILHPLFVDNPSSYLYASPLHHHTPSNAGSRLEGGGAFSTATSPSSASLRQGGLVASASEATCSSHQQQPVTSPRQHHHQTAATYHPPPPALGLRPIGEYPQQPTTTGDIYSFDYRVNEQQQQPSHHQQQQQGGPPSSFGSLSTYRLYPGGDRPQNDQPSNASTSNDAGGGHEGVNDNTSTNNSSGILNP